VREGAGVTRRANLNIPNYFAVRVKPVS